MNRRAVLIAALSALAAQTASADCYKLYLDAANRGPSPLWKTSQRTVITGFVMSSFGILLNAADPCGASRSRTTTGWDACTRGGVGLAFGGFAVAAIGDHLTGKARREDDLNRSLAPDYLLNAESIREATDITNQSPTGTDPDAALNSALADIRDLAVRQSPDLDPKPFTIQLAAEATHDLDHTNVLCPKGMLYDRQQFRMIVAAEIRNRVKDKSGLGD